MFPTPFLTQATATRMTMIVAGVEYGMYDGVELFSTPYGPVYMTYVSDDGLGLPPITRFSERGPMQDGDVDIGFVYEPRLVTMIFGIYAPLSADSRYLEEAQGLILRRFLPTNTPISFRWDRAVGTVRQIDGHVVGGLTFPSTDRVANTWYKPFSVQIKMNDPTFYDPDEHDELIENTSISGFANGVNVPLDVPFGVRSGNLLSNLNILYTGTYPAYPVIELYGELRNPVVQNVLSGKRIDLYGAYIPAGEVYTIDLRHSLKTITDSSDNNRTGELNATTVSDLSTWRLEVISALQNIIVSADYAGGQTNVARIRWLDRFVGV